MGRARGLQRILIPSPSSPCVSSVWDQCPPVPRSEGLAAGGRGPQHVTGTEPSRSLESGVQSALTSSSLPISLRARSESRKKACGARRLPGRSALPQRLRCRRRLLMLAIWWGGIWHSHPGLKGRLPAKAQVWHCCHGFQTQAHVGRGALL